MSATEQDIREVAENLLTNSQQSSSHHARSTPTTPLEHSINMRPEFFPEDLVTGFRQNNRMSAVRRFFCLFVTFDFLFTSLMWLICIMLVDPDIFAALTKQVIRYDIHRSLFDVVMSAACRFVVLLLFYGLLQSNHWFIIALSTGGTCCFLIAKVFLYNWAQASQPVFQVLLVLTSFVISWGEAWFLDFRVLPQELQATEFLQASPLCSDSERAPLLKHYIQGVTRYHDNYTESVGNFYSPLESPAGSDDENETDPKGDRKIVGAFHEERLKKLGAEILAISWDIISSEDWKLEKKNAKGDTVHSKKLFKGRKIFKLAAIVDLPPQILFNELFHNIENVPTWNPTVIESRRVQVLDDNTDVIYQVAAEGAGGIVTCRDFVLLRRRGMKDSSYISSSVSINHPSVPIHKKYIRGESGATCWVMSPVAGEEGQCLFRWLVNMDLKGWIPQYVIDTALISAMLDYMDYLRTYSQKLKQERNSECS